MAGIEYDDQERNKKDLGKFSACFDHNTVQSLDLPKTQ